MNVALFNLWLLQEQKTIYIYIYIYITANGKYNLDGYDIKAFNQNLYDENLWDFYFRNQTVAFYYNRIE